MYGFSPFVSAQVEQFYSFLCTDEKNVVLFVNEALKFFWLEQCAKYKGVVVNSQFIKLEKIEEKLCYNIAQKMGKQLRVLTFAERKVMITDFLSQKNIQSQIMTLEGSKIKESFDVCFEITYAQKLLKLFNHYPLFCTQKETRHYKQVKQILSQYTYFLNKNECIDYASASFMLFDEPDLCGDDMCVNVLLAFPKLFSIGQTLWLKQCEKKIKTFSYVIQKEKFMRDEKTTKAYKKCDNVAQELSFVTQNIANLLAQGTALSDIALTVCEIDSFIENDIASLRFRYDVPFFYNKKARGGILYESLQTLAACIDTNMHPHAIKKALLHPSLSWKNRNIQLQLVQIGLENNCVDSHNLTFWNDVLSHPRTHKKIKDYFFSFYYQFKKVKNAKSFVKLQKEFDIFVKRFIYVDSFTFESSKKNEVLQEQAYKIDGIVVRKIREIIKELVVLEKYRESIDTNFGLHNSVWDILCAVSLNRSDVDVQYTHNTVAVYKFPESAGMWYKHHFFANLTQKALTNVGRIGVFFDQHTDDELFLKLVEKQQKQQIEFCKDIIDFGGNNILLSTSLESYQSIQRSVTGWNFDVECVKNDFVSIENFFWKDSIDQKTDKKIQTQYFEQISKNMCDGIKAQLTTEDKTQTNVFLKPLDVQTKQIITKLFLEKSLSVSSIQQLMLDPLSFLFEKTLGVQAMFTSLDTHFSSKQKFGILLHKRFENMFSAAKNKEGENNIIFNSDIHFFLKTSFQNIVFSREVQEFLKEIHVFLIKDVCKEFVGDTTQCVFETEVKLKEYLDDIFSHKMPHVLISGKSDLVLHSSNDEQEKFVIDYKSTEKELVFLLIQVWLYFKLLKSKTDFIKTPKASADFLSKSLRGAVFPIVKNYNNFLQKKEYQFSSYVQKKSIEKTYNYVQNFERFLSDGIQSILNGDFTQSFKTKESDKLYNDMKKELTVKLHVSLENKIVFRDGCYIYTNR